MSKTAIIERPHGSQVYDKQVQNEKKSVEVNQQAKAEDKSNTEKPIVLFGGLTKATDYFIEAAFQSLGLKAQGLDCPDNESLRFGKEFCNRALCNPSYYTVGNLVKYLTQLRDEQGLTTEEINKGYIFLTAGACGPCRFGMYESEYKKALAAAGFEGFRVTLFEQSVELKTEEEVPVVDYNFKFYVALVKAILAGDIINTLGYRIRPYEVEEGATDEALEQCKKVVYTAFQKKKSLVRAFLKVRKILSKIEVNYLQAKPLVALTGEFWAMTTEGDGNYNIHKWLEKEGAEIHTQNIATWVDFIIWESEKWFRDRIHLKNHDEKGLKESNPKKALRLFTVGKLAFKLYFNTYKWAAGLKEDKSPDIKELADYAHDHYHTNLSGGEGHLEVGEFIAAAKKSEAHLVLSIKPFGCMPSASVSDGVQSKVQELYPEVIFYPIETSGDGAVNVYSRVQMMLFRAKKMAKEDFDAALAETGIDVEELIQSNKLGKHKVALNRSPHKKACTAANVLYDLV